MTRHQAKKVLEKLATSTILSEKIKAQLANISLHICNEDFDDCTPTECGSEKKCANCMFFEENDD